MLSPIAVNRGGSRFWTISTRRRHVDSASAASYANGLLPPSPSAWKVLVDVISSSRDGEPNMFRGSRV